jgi:N-acetyl-gamma-glutamyl-phosphate reductase
MINLAIVGATGFTGHELLKLLANHEEADVKVVTSTRQAGLAISEIYPDLRTDLVLSEYSLEVLLKHKIDCVFLAVPHGSSMDLAAEIIKEGIKVIDLSADFRLQDLSLYEKYYVTHRAPELLKEAVYGLSEHMRADIRGASLIANPGCYVTSSLLALLPIAKDIHSVIIDAKSGVSGAGKKAVEATSFVNVSGDFKPYSIGIHRHQPEIESHLGQPVVFTPHLLPIARGILSTIYVKSDKSKDDLKQMLQVAYEKESFVRVLDNEKMPTISMVAGSNNCAINIFNVGSGQHVIISALDNMVKGASGQAIQNMNILFGVAERMGLTRLPDYP